MRSDAEMAAVGRLRCVLERKRLRLLRRAADGQREEHDAGDESTSHVRSVVRDLVVDELFDLVNVVIARTVGRARRPRLA